MSESRDFKAVGDCSLPQCEQAFYFPTCQTLFHPILWFFKLQLSLLIILSTSMFYLSHIGLVLYLGQESRKKSQDGGEDGGVLEDALEGL